jgi:hypothetical protein
MLCPQCKNEMVVLAEFVEARFENWIFVQAICKNCKIGFEGPIVGMDLDKVEDLIVGGVS